MVQLTESMFFPEYELVLRFRSESLLGRDASNWDESIVGPHTSALWKLPLKIDPNNALVSVPKKYSQPFRDPLWIVPPARPKKNKLPYLQDAQGET